MSVIEKLIQINNEHLIGNWKLSVAPFRNGKRISGFLFVTDKKIYFESGYHYLIRNQIDSINNANTFSQDLINYWYDYGYFIIHKKDIKHVEKDISLLKKKFTITLTDETKYNFIKGIFPINKITEAININ